MKPLQKLNEQTAQRLAYRVKEAVTLTGLSRTHLFNLRRAGKLRMTRLGGVNLIAADELHRLIKEGA
jgi:excisionase family DNA binding protein